MIDRNKQIKPRQKVKETKNPMTNNLGLIKNNI